MATTVTRQWLRDGVSIPGATGTTYVLTADDVGALIRCRETGTNAAGTVTQDSNALGPVAVLVAGGVEPDSTAIAPSIGATSPSPRQKVIKKGAALSDTISLSAPAQTGSALVLVVAANGPAVINTPAGWTALTGATQQTGNVTQHVFGRANAGGVSSVTWTAASGTATAATAYLIEVQDCHTSAPFVEGVKAVGNVSTLARTTGAATGAALTYDNTLALAFAAVDAGASVDATTTRGFSDSFVTEIFSASNATAPAVAMGSRLYATAPVGARYYRMLVTNNGYYTKGTNTHSIVQMAEFKFLSGAGGTDVGAGAAAVTADSSFSGEFPVSNIYDGSLVSVWASAETGGNGAHWVSYDKGLGNTMAPLAISIQARSNATQNDLDQMPCSGNIQSSPDGVTWTTRWSFSTGATWAASETRTFSHPSAVAAPTSTWSWTGDATDETILGMVAIRPAVAVATARYWRVDVEDISTATGSISALDVELREAVGGADATGSGTAFAHGTFQNIASFAPDKAFHGASNEYWVGTDLKKMGWLGYDFGMGQTRTIREFDWQARSDSPLEAPSAGFLSYSNDNVSFTRAFDFTTPKTWAGSERRAFSGAFHETPAATRWRLFIRRNQSNTGGGSVHAISCEYIAFRETSGGAILSTGGTAISDTFFLNNATYAPSQAFVSDSNFWVSEDANPGTHWIGYVHGSNVKVGHVTWRARPDSFGPPEQPVWVLVQYSTDGGTTWITDWVFNTPATWTNGETRTFTKP